MHLGKNNLNCACVILDLSVSFNSGMRCLIHNQQCSEVTGQISGAFS